MDEHNKPYNDWESGSAYDQGPTASLNRFCTHCGTPIKPGTRFCTGCGKPLSGDTAQRNSGVVVEPKGKSSLILKIAIALVLAIVLIVLGLNFGSIQSTANGCSGPAGLVTVSSEDTDSTDTTEGEGIDDVDDGDDVDDVDDVDVVDEPDDESTSSSEETSSTESEEPVVEEDPHAAPQRAGLAEYSWDELSAIADEIAQASDPIEIARYYKLVNSSGKLEGQVKLVKFAGVEHYVQIIGFAQDEKTSGGKAGITFQFTDILALKKMRNSKSNAGGWAYNNDIRDWLGSRVGGKLPKELRRHIVSVEKLTNNDGKTSRTSSVTASSDKLWIPSYIEVFGTTDKAVLSAEGSQYQRFRDEGVTDAHDSTERVKNPTLIKTYKGSKKSWWLRSPNPESSTTVYDIYSTTGEWNMSHANTGGSIGVCPCFCL